MAIVGGIVDPFSTEQLIRWQTDFFNRSVRSTRVIGADVVVDPATGRFGPKTDEIPELNARYVIVEPGVGVIGRLVADRPPLALYEVEQPLRIATAVEGLFPDGWSGDSAAFTMYGGASGAPTSMAVTVSRARWTGSEVFSVVEISIGPLGVGVDGQPAIRIVTDSEAVGAGSGSQSTVSLAAPPPPFRVEIEVENTFSPADVGAADTRELGVQVSFAPVE